MKQASSGLLNPPVRRLEGGAGPSLPEMAGQRWHPRGVGSAAAPCHDEPRIGGLTNCPSSPACAPPVRSGSIPVIGREGQLGRMNGTEQAEILPHRIVTVQK